MAIATFGFVVLDCPDPRRLADFYGTLLGWSEEPGGDDDWIELTGPNGQGLAFQRVADHRPPEWPGSERPQQAHLDLNVPREQLDDAEARTLQLGATRLLGEAGDDRGFRVYADPAGHPFCLCRQ